MVIGTLAITGVGIPADRHRLRRLPVQGRHHRDDLRGRERASASIAFGLLVVSAIFTAFYSWRLIFMTFHGPTRADRHTYEHAHESPTVMMIPLYVLAAGAALAGMIWFEQLRRPPRAGVVGPVDRQPGRDPRRAAARGLAPRAMACEGQPPSSPCWSGSASPTSSTSPGPRCRTQLAAPARAALPVPAQQVVFRRALRLDLRAARHGARPFPLAASGDGATIDGFLNGLAMGVVPWLTRFAGRVQSGFIFHYAFAMLIGVSAADHLVRHSTEGERERHQPSLARHLPAAGRRGGADHLPARRRRGRAR